MNAGPRAVLALVGVAMLSGGTARGEEPVRVTVKESDELLANPGMGWQTFHQFNHHDKNLGGLPTASAYFRFYWREIEPEQGRIDFAKLDGMLAHGKDVGQRIAMRVMCLGSDEEADVPAWLIARGCRGTTALNEGRRHWVPDMTDPAFQEAHFRLIEALGARYDGHPALDVLDIGTVGQWGEWHMAGLKTDDGQDLPMPPVEVQNAVIDAWIVAFPKTPKVVLVGSDVGMARAAKEGLGWRADCLGDLGLFTPRWNHMEHMYPQAVAKAGAGDAWKAAPVAFESCADMRAWAERGWPIGTILDFALEQHASYLNNKSAPLPEGARPEVERFLRRLGYRLAVRTVEHPRSARAGGPLTVDVAWENVGVAPPYGDFRVAVRLTPLGTPTGRTSAWTSDRSVRGWLPGAHRTRLEMPLPADLPPGRYGLALGVVDPATAAPAIRLPTEGRTPEGWSPVGELTVTGP